ncbi:hypothetical protein KIKIMORA_00690 [Brevundimonas phage vB_BpoS-Kikimora]|uniref:Uncharacterized protein n=1 Tax=Brevundimonas phage vB_BpoS-Kikimora TaxID=2948601 RepID=A0A9E7MSD4_9CAUD|nr:hypothetical protein KIKIMORA_00690 [Brevundimonas phage vB_BpoS-Kikimora]
MTTIAELFAQEPLRIERGLGVLAGFYYNHLPEIDETLLSGLRYREDAFQEIEVVAFHEAIEDHRRSWLLFGVRFEGRWVMLCRNAGRELDDFHDRQVVDVAAYQALIAYVRTELVRLGETPEPVATPLDTEVEFAFYGHDVRHPRRY